MTQNSAVTIGNFLSAAFPTFAPGYSEFGGLEHRSQCNESNYCHSSTFNHINITNFSSTRSKLKPVMRAFRNGSRFFGKTQNSLPPGSVACGRWIG